MMQANLISLSDLLNRDVKPKYTRQTFLSLKNQSVLVTGAGGSIGSEIVRQLKNIGAKNVICLDRDEYALYKLQLGLTGSALLTDEQFMLADVQNYYALAAIIKHFQPNMVFHAAAVKHLPLLEKSPDVAILTNVLGSENVVKACVENGVQRLVNISTDKAANPISVLGETKRLAEMIARAYSGHGTRISSVRFGNVFASRGSFIETLRWQIAHNQPITITDPKATRYFMTIPQAAGLVLEASQLADSGETYILDMGAPVKIMEIVNKYMAMTGKQSVILTHSGLRIGEKRHEELIHDHEIEHATRHPQISSLALLNQNKHILDDVHSLYTKILNTNYTKDGLCKELARLAKDK